METQIETPWQCTLRATTNTLDNGILSRDLKHRWVLEVSTTGRDGLSIQRIEWGSVTSCINDKEIVWDVEMDYETEWECGGLPASIWWPVKHKPAPVQPRPTYNVLVLVDRGGIVEVGTDGLLNVYILDETIKDHPNEPTKQEKQFFGTVWDRLPDHRGVDSNPPIYDFAQVGL